MSDLSVEPQSPVVVASEQPQATVQDDRQALRNSFLTTFGSTFLTIFLAELGDKTQIATLLMSAQSHQPLTVFAGAATALVATSLIGVLIGRWLCQNLSPKTLEKATGCLLLVVAVLLIVDVVGM